MDKRNNKMELLGNAPLPKALFAMGFPTMIGMMINALYNLVDAYFVGGLGTRQMVAISIAFPLGQVVVGLGLLFGNGAASYISRLLGNGEKEAANKVASTALYSSLFVGAAAIICAIVFLKPILLQLGATESVMPYAMTYTSIYVASSILNIFNVTMNNIATSEGAAKTAMYALLAGAGLNIVLDPLFIYTLNLGVAGAAITTAISQAVSTLVYLGCILRKKSVFHFHIRDCSFSKDVMSEILKIGVPTLFFQILTSLSITLVNTHVKEYGDSAIAGMGAVTRFAAMGSLMVFGFIKGFQPIAGFSYGAKKYDRLREAIRTSVVWSTGFCAIFGLVMVLFPEAIVSQFTQSDAVMIDVGRTALWAYGFSFLLLGFHTVYSSLFLALGKAKEGFFLGVCRQGICFIPIVLCLPIVWGINGILYAQPISDALTAVITGFMALHLHKELNAEKSHVTQKNN